MSTEARYRKTEAQELTFEILKDDKKIFEGIDIDDCEAVKERLQKIEKLTLFGYIGMSDLSIVGEMINLRELDFESTNVTDISWARSLKHLENIDFSFTDVSGLESLAELKKLKEIRASGCKQLTPADIEAIFDLPLESLEDLHLRRTPTNLEPIVRRMKERHAGKVRIRYDLLGR